MGPSDHGLGSLGAPIRGSSLSSSGFWPRALFCWAGHLIQVAKLLTTDGTCIMEKTRDARSRGPESASEESPEWSGRGGGVASFGAEGRNCCRASRLSAPKAEAGVFRLKSNGRPAVSPNPRFTEC